MGHILGIDLMIRFSGRSRLLMAEEIYDPELTDFLPDPAEGDEGEGCQDERD